MSLSSYLYHHGIKGQEWDKRNGPPYPLDPEDHSAREKKGERSPNSSLAKSSSKSVSGKKDAKLSKGEIAKKKQQMAQKNLSLLNKHDQARARMMSEGMWDAEQEKHYKSMVEGILKKLSGEGITIKSKEVNRYVSRGKGVSEIITGKSYEIVTQSKTKKKKKS